MVDVVARHISVALDGEQIFMQFGDIGEGQLLVLVLDLLQHGSVLILQTGENVFCKGRLIDLIQFVFKDAL